MTLIQDLHAAISRRDWHSVEVAANRLRDTNIEATNAALTTRVKEMSALIDGENCADPDKIDALFRRAETAETQLAAAKKALEFYGDVSKYPAPLTGGMGALWSDCGAIARAALEAKP